MYVQTVLWLVVRSNGCLVKKSQQSSYQLCGKGYSGVVAMKQSVIKGNGGEERRCDEGGDETKVMLVLVGVVFDDT
jgi:hypothetical protein